MEAVFQEIRQELRPMFGATLALLIITCVVYPLVVTGIGQVAFHREANGSIISVDGRPVGSSLIGQQFSAAKYFQPRPSSAGDGYDASSSSGSNLGPSSAKLLTTIHERATAYRDLNGLPAEQLIPADAVTASASGLDPHISPANARLQIGRVAQARGVSDLDVQKLLDDYVENGSGGVIGEARVNVLKLNIALDKRYPGQD